MSKFTAIAAAARKGTQAARATTKAKAAAKTATAEKKPRKLSKVAAANRKLKAAGYYLHPRTGLYVKATSAGRKKMMAAHKRLKGKKLSAEHKKKISLALRHARKTGKTKTGRKVLWGKRDPKTKKQIRPTAQIKPANAKKNQAILKAQREARAAQRHASKEKAGSKAPAKKAGTKAPAKKTTTKAPAKAPAKTKAAPRGRKANAGLTL